YTAIDGGFHVHVGVHGAFGLEVAERGESVVERDAGVAGRDDRAIRDGPFQELLVVFRGGDVSIEEEVGVRVNEAGQHGGVGEINHGGARWRRASGGDGDDFSAGDDDQGIGDGAVAFAVNQFACADGDLPGGLGVGGEGAGEDQRGKDEFAQHEPSSKGDWRCRWRVHVSSGGHRSAIGGFGSGDGAQHNIRRGCVPYIRRIFDECFQYDRGNSNPRTVD